MIWVLAGLAVLAVGAISVVAAGGGAPLSPSYDDRPDVVVPADRPLEAADLTAIRFTTAFRGYRASEVDALLDRLAAQLASQARQQPTQPTQPAGDPESPESSPQD